MEDFNCKSVRTNLWDYAAQALPQPENDAIDAHLDACRDCDRSLADVSSLRTGFRHLPVQAVPPLLQTRLQVIASRERSRQLLRLNPGAWLRDKLASAVLAFDHFLRPFAVPATGGLLASCLCFSLIAHTLQLRPYLAGDDDMPIGIFTEMTIDDVSPFSFSGKDVTMQVTVDANGSVSDYSMLQGSKPTPEEFEAIGSLLLYSTFTPAMRAGQPVSSKRLFAIRHVNVRD
jgi:hypothetical protein